MGYGESGRLVASHANRGPEPNERGADALRVNRELTLVHQVGYDPLPQQDGSI